MRRCLLLTVIACVTLAGCFAPAADDTQGGPSTSKTASTPTVTQSAAPRPTIPGATPAVERRARRAVAKMGLRQRAGQVIVASYGGTRAPADLVTRENLAGVITFSENIASVDGLRRDLARLQRADDRPWPVFAGVDQEGGVVARAGAPLTEFPTFMTYGAARRTDLASAAARASGEELRATGFTAVFAPDADVTIGPSDPTIGSRSAGSQPRTVADMANAAVVGYRQAGILPVLKHFPGHGSVPADSHLELPVQTASLRTLRRRDLVPFQAAADNDAPAVMIGHIDLRAVHRGVPSSVSRRVVGGLLRERMGFRGLVVTDSLQMRALTDRLTTGQAAVRALRAGADLLLMPPEPVVAKRAIVSAVRDGRLPARRLEKAATRVVAQLMHVGETTAPPRSVIGSHRPVSRRASAAAVTVTDGRCAGRLVGRSVRVSGHGVVVRRFAQAAENAGLGVGSGDSVAIVGYGGGSVSADVAVSTDTPYVLGRSTARVKIATFGETPGAMRALVDVLLGTRTAPGSLPVRVSGVTRRGC